MIRNYNQQLFNSIAGCRNLVFIINVRIVRITQSLTKRQMNPVDPEAYNITEQDSLLGCDRFQQRMRACDGAQCFYLLTTTAHTNIQKYFNLTNDSRRRGQIIYTGSK